MSTSHSLSDIRRTNVPKFMIEVSDGEMARWTEYQDNEGYVNDPRLLTSPASLIRIGLEIVELDIVSIFKLED